MLNLLLHITGIARLADEIQWPSSDMYSVPLEGIGGQDSDTIDSYSDDSFSDFSVHTSPEIGRRQIDRSEIDDSGSSPGSPMPTKLLGGEERADSAERKGRRWKSRLIELQTSTPVSNRTQSEVCVHIFNTKVTSFSVAVAEDD